MNVRPWIKDVVFVGLCLTGLAVLVLGFAWPRGSLASELDADTAASAEAKRDEITEVASAVDAALADEQRAAGVEPAPRAPTLTVARRLSLALTGTIPSLEEIRALEAQPREAALAWWVEHLLSDRRFADYFAERFARALVGVDRGAFIAYRRRRLVAWLADQLAANRPWDRVAAEMISGTGLWTQRPQTNFVTAAVEPGSGVPDEAALAARLSRALLGVRLDCAQCHDHPFDDRWTQRDFHGLAAFFGRSKLTVRGVQEVRGAYHYDDLMQARTVTIEPTVPFAPELLPDHGSDRERLAAWVTHPKNPAFSRAVTNRVWALMLGRPLVSPVDELPIDAPVPPALELLAEDFAAHGFDLRRLIRTIAATETFARASERRQAPGSVLASDEAPPAPACPELGEAEADPRLCASLSTWAEFPLTRLRPEQVVGALLQAASLRTIDHASHVLVQLAFATRQKSFVTRYGDAGEHELEGDGGTIPQRLLLLNGALVHERIEDDLVGNAVTRIAALTDDDARAVEAAYLAVLTRRPTQAESEHFRGRLAGTSGKARRRVLADLYWALINSTELAWNH